ncbi:zinc-containing alcohol dehydrogenase, putative [Cordyceps militaris CM01]|uniref:Zinc-containing alcohol dehydrogenase, putative n=1 Tax=Cordyceps militaris (strain CM01) TaxID=983644 RepID=G3JFQ5_CORMM|nr:zinc-containing alcohol dehydrogenase, putative [Cordyceps militaris CM01]EGX92288.1 zinc-containing alcohol dehydrogenase, putative [Cordyceps militaris CM01]
MPETMRAVQVLGDKSAPQLSFVRTVPVPSATSDEVLVRISAAGITADEISWPELYESNRVPGHDIAGTVISVGPDYKGSVKSGDEIFAMIKAATRAGGQADFVAVGGNDVARKPARLSMGEAAALPIPVLTAWEALHEHTTIQKGDRVLVTGASGAVGTMLVQIASKVLGAEVTALASAKSHAHLQSLGASHCIDYHATGWESRVGAVDAVFDTVGSDVYRKSWRSLRQGGTMVTVADPPPEWAFSGGKPEELAGNPDAKFVYFIVTASGERLGATASLFDSGVLKPLPVVEFEADDALQAWKYAGQRGKDGKAVIKFT